MSVKKYTICDNNEFSDIYKQGKKIVGKNIVFYYKKNNQNFNRLGITVSKKIGNAVARNRAKRVIRAAYRQCYFPVGFDFVVVARGRATECKSYNIKSFFEYKVVGNL
ncbi:ribonuclease P protein component [Clostridia bacterium]|nr:ribonuclease P protein component [Clostridia bacterium]